MVQTNTFARRTSRQRLLSDQPKGGTPHDAQGHVIAAHGTRTMSMRLEPEGQSVGAGVQIHEPKITDPNHGEVGQARLPSRSSVTCDRSVSLDVVDNSLWADVRAHTTASSHQRLSTEANLKFPDKVFTRCLFPLFVPCVYYFSHSKVASGRAQGRSQGR